MNDRGRKAAFVNRFDEAWAAVRRAELWLGVLRALFVAGCGMVLLAAVDYFLELPWRLRAIALGVVGCFTAIAAAAGLLAPLFRWSRQRTAVAVEQRFPQLGQRVRTVVQFSGREKQEVASQGVAPGLVNALEEETEARAAPLDLRRVAPWRKLRTVAVVACAAPVALLVCGFLCGLETRLAIRRALLDDQPYTLLTVAPGDVVVDEGDDLTISLELKGRLHRRVSFFTRRIDDSAAWQERELTEHDASAPDPHLLEYKLTLEDVQRPMEYRVIAGPAESEVYRVTVRHPLAIKQFKAIITPPAYTAVAPKTVEGGDLEVIAGSQVKFQIQFDRPSVNASLVFSHPPYKAKVAESGGVSQPKRVPLKLEEGALAADLEFLEDQLYSIAATAREGPSLPDNRYRIRVRKDAAPRVFFEKPYETLEVHGIAEVLMRIRARDDFGLSKAGIVFQVNNGEELTLLTRDLSAITRQDNEVGRRKPTLNEVCENTLLLEDYDLTPTDSVTYYAFAEDNSPAGPKRTETDLRFIDIRSFRRVYKVGGT